MPSVSRAQQRLMQAAEHGATFPKAKKLRQTMTRQQLQDFASGSEAGKPTRVRHGKTLAAHAERFGTGAHPHKNLGRYLHPKKAR